MKRLITLIFISLSFAGFSQTNATFNNLDVRNKSTFRGYHYIYDSTFFKPTGSNIPWWDLTDTLGFVLSVSNPNESQLVKVRLSTLLDSLAIVGSVDSFYVAYGCYDNIDTWLYNSDTIYVDTCQLWYLDGDTIINVSDYKVRMTDEVYIYPLPPEATKTGRIMHINQYGQIEWMSPATLVDTLEILMPQYWTFVNSGTDTLKNNVATGDSPGVVAIKGNLELETTNSTATEGVVKQNGVNLIHTYHEKSNSNLFIGLSSGNFSADSANNLGVGNSIMNNLTTGYANTSIGNSSLYSITAGYENVSIGYRTLENIRGSSRNTAVGHGAMRYANNTASETNSANTAIGYTAMEMGNTPASNTGYSNTAIGSGALAKLTSGYENTAVGNLSLTTTTIGNSNVAVGYNSLRNNAEGIKNTSIGHTSMYSNGDNDASTAIGWGSMYYCDSRTTGERVTYNTAIGYEAMRGSTTSANNTGQNNTAVGYQALDAMTSADSNTVMGVNAGGAITTGGNNLLLGYGAGATLTTQNNLIYIGNTNNTDTYLNGTVHYVDTHWDDLSTSATQAKIGVNNTPVFDYDTLAILWDNTPIDTTNQYIVLNYQLPHRWAAGTDLYLHVHYLQHSASDTCEWFKAEYKWTDMGETRAGAYTTTKTTNQTVYTYTANSLHQIAAFPAISGVGKTESSVLQIKLYCNSDANLYSLDTDIHFEIDKPGSDSQFP